MERCIGLKRKRRLGHTRAIAPSHVEVPLPSVLVLNRRCCPWVPAGVRRHGPARLGAVSGVEMLTHGAPRAGGKFLDGQPTLSAQSFATGANPFCTTDFPVGAAGWGLRPSNGQWPKKVCQQWKEVKTGRLLSLPGPFPLWMKAPGDSTSASLLHGGAACEPRRFLFLFPTNRATDRF